MNDACWFLCYGKTINVRTCQRVDKSTSLGIIYVRRSIPWCTDDLRATDQPISSNNSSRVTEKFQHWLTYKWCLVMLLVRWTCTCSQLSCLTPVTVQYGVEVKSFPSLLVLRGSTNLCFISPRLDTSWSYETTDKGYYIAWYAHLLPTFAGTL